jgi:hypothetical protein
MIRAAIITVDATVVATDSEYVLSCTALPIVSGMNCGETSKPNNVIPSTEGVYQFIYHREPSHTYRPEIEDQGDDCCCPTSVANDPTPPDLQFGGY